MNSKTTTNTNQKESKNKNHFKYKDIKISDSENNVLFSNPVNEDNVLLDTTDYIVTPTGLDDMTKQIVTKPNVQIQMETSDNTCIVDVPVNLLNEKEKGKNEQNEQNNKLTEQLDFFKNLAEENKEQINNLKTTLEENRVFILQLVEENEKLKNNLSKMNNIELLIKLKENFSNKSVELVEEIKFDNQVENTNINKFVQEKIQAQIQAQSMQENTQSDSNVLPKVIIVKPKKKSNPFARRFL